jgi:hypothetical protein
MRVILILLVFAFCISYATANSPDLLPFDFNVRSRMLELHIRPQTPKEQQYWATFAHQIENEVVAKARYWKSFLAEQTWVMPLGELCHKCDAFGSQNPGGSQRCAGCASNNIAGPLIPTNKDSVIGFFPVNGANYAPLYQGTKTLFPGTNLPRFFVHAESFLSQVDYIISPVPSNATTLAEWAKIIDAINAFITLGYYSRVSTNDNAFFGTNGMRAFARAFISATTTANSNLQAFANAASSTLVSSANGFTNFNNAIVKTSPYNIDDPSYTYKSLDECNGTTFEFSQETKLLMELLPINPRTSAEEMIFNQYLSVVKDTLIGNLTAFAAIVSKRQFDVKFGVFTENTIGNYTGTLLGNLKTPFIRFAETPEAQIQSPNWKARARRFQQVANFTMFERDATEFLEFNEKVTASDISKTSHINKWASILDVLQKVPTEARHFKTKPHRCPGANGFWYGLQALLPPEDDPFDGGITTDFGNVLDALGAINTSTLPAYNPLDSEFTGQSSALPTTASEIAYVKEQQQLLKDRIANSQEFIKNLQTNVTADFPTASSGSRRLLAVVTQSLLDSFNAFCAQTTLTTVQQDSCARAQAELTLLQEALALFSPALAAQATTLSPSQWSTFASAGLGVEAVLVDLESAGSLGGVVNAMAGSTNPGFQAAANNLNQVVQAAVQAAQAADSVVVASTSFNTGSVVGIIVAAVLAFTPLALISCRQL